MTTTATPSSTLLTNRINRIEVSATMAVAAEAEKLRASGVDVVDFGVGEPHFHTPQHVKEAAITAINNNFSRYTAAGGTLELRDAIVKRHDTDFGSGYKREECMASVGGKHVLFNAISVLVDHGDEVILPVPYWVSFKDMIRFCGGTPVFIETDEKDDFALTAEMVERAITPRTKLIILNSPNNPSGAVMKPEDQISVLRLAHERGIYVISDECYVYLNYTGRLFSAGEVHDVKEHLLIVGSLSKTYAMTGWRLGYVLAPASIVQKAGVAALTGPQECIAEMRKDYIHLRDIAEAGLRAIPGVTCANANGAFYVFPNLSHFFGRQGLNSAADVARKLLQEAHVAIVPGEAFGSSKHARISYPVAEHDLKRGLERMKQFFANL